jgi:tripartite-type tricarboxylate transporter receptor subunit TctC
MRMLPTLLAACLGLACAGVQAQGYPSRPVRVVVPFPAGGPVDNVARSLGAELAKTLGQQFVVDNRAGGNTIIGTDAVAKSAPDGYTLLVAVSSFLTTPMLNKAPYDALKDFSPVAFIAQAPLVVVTNTTLPAANMKELIEYSKKNPEKMTFGIGSIGAPAHLAQEQFKRRTGMAMTMIPYKGTTPIFQDLIGGQIAGTFEPVLGALPYIQGGRVKPLAITSLKRVVSLPNVPTVDESGFPGFEAYTWYALWGPAGMPAEVTKKLNDETNKAMRTPEMHERMDKLGFEIVPGTPESFGKFLREDARRAATVIKDANIKAE